MMALGFFLIIFFFFIKLLNRLVYERNIINLKFPGIINHLKCWEFCIGQSIKQKDASLRHEGVTDSLTHDYFPMRKAQLATEIKHFSKHPITQLKSNLICLEIYFFFLEGLWYSCCRIIMRLTTSVRFSDQMLDFVMAEKALFVG